MVEPFPLIEISGPPRERGRQYGQKAVARIKKGTSHYFAQLKELSLDAKGVAELVRDYLPVIEAFEPSYIEEMRGIAEGADLPFEDVVLLNARTEIIKLANPAIRARLKTPEDPDGCTGVVVMPQATASGRLIHAQNWDWKRECAETAVVLKVRRDDGPDLMTFTEAGALGRCGFNAVGIAITANYLQSDRDYRQVGVPLALIRRKVLENEHLALAMRAVYSTRKSAANNMIVSHREGVAIDFECAPDETFQVHPQNDLLVHANHFVAPSARAKLRDLSLLSNTDSLYRDVRVRKHLRNAAPEITIETFQTAFQDRYGSPRAVCRSLFTADNGLPSATTVSTILMDTTLRKMWVAPRPYGPHRFTEYTLD